MCNTTTKHKDFVITTDAQELVDQLSDETAGSLFKAIIHYASTGEQPQYNDLLSKFAFYGVTRFANVVWSEFGDISDCFGRKRRGAPKGNCNASKRNEQAKGVFSLETVNDDNEEQEGDIIEDEEEAPAAEENKEQESEEEPLPKGVTINYGKLLAFFNEMMKGQVIPTLKIITQKRKNNINARCREYGKNAIFEAISKAAKSDFLNGKNNRGWVADFDWIFRPNNFPKVLEGNYDNKATAQGESGQDIYDKHSGNYDAGHLNVEEYEKTWDDILGKSNNNDK